MKKSQLLTGLAGLLVVVAVAAAVFTGVRFWNLHSEEKARDEALAAARDYSVSMFSRDPKTVSDNVNRTMGVLTGSAKDDFQRIVTEYKIVESVKRDTIVTQITIQGAAVMQNTRDTAKVLVYLNQSSTKKASQDVQVDPSRIVYDMVKQGGKWMISTMDILTDESLKDRVQTADDGAPSTAVPIPGTPTTPAAPTTTPAP